MVEFEYFVAGVLPYLTVTVFALGLFYKLIRWQTSPEHLPWELYPYPETFGEQIKELLKEVTTLHSLIKNNRRVWIQSLLLHWGLYILGLWIILNLIGLGVAYYVGLIGATLTLVGSITLFLVRISNTELRRISAFVEYFNLTFLMALSGSALYSNFFRIDLKTYLLSLIAFKPNVTMFTTEDILTLLLVQLFLIYLPLSRLVHFVGKYFTYHKVKWGEAE